MSSNKIEHFETGSKLCLLRSTLKGVIMPKLLAMLGSPRRQGNTALLFQETVKGARDGGAEVDEVVLRDLKMSPCLEIYGCKKTGRCAINDDFQGIYDRLLSCEGIILASPIFFYTVSAHTKILMDRCQSLWVKKYWIEKTPFGKQDGGKKALFISVGATKGKKLFDGVMITLKYFLNTFDAEIWKSLLYRGLDFEGDVLKHPEYLKEAYQTGKEMAGVL